MTAPRRLSDWNKTQRGERAEDVIFGQRFPRNIILGTGEQSKTSQRSASDHALNRDFHL